MFLRLDENNIVAELPGIPYDDRMRPRFHPAIMARIVWVPSGGEHGDIYDPVTGTCSKPPIVPPDPAEAVARRVVEIQLLYVQALLTRDQQLANQLETEYIAITNTAPAVPGDTTKETTP
jgi:hypothetical protein